MSSIVIEVCRNLDIHNMFVSDEHPHANGHTEAANRIILSGMKKKLDEANGLWAEYLHEILWLYHTTPHSTTKDTPFQMVYRDDEMIHIEVNYLT